MGAILATILGSLITSVAGAYTKTIDASVETYKAGVGATVSLASTSATLIGTAMSHKMYWWAWGLAVIPMSVWFGVGMVDTIHPGLLPPVAEIPPGLKTYADAVWNNLFWTGGGLYAFDKGSNILADWLNK